MAQLSEIIERETNRKEWRTIFFYKEGAILRAYEWSAWLWCRHINDFNPINRDKQYSRRLCDIAHMAERNLLMCNSKIMRKYETTF